MVWARATASSPPPQPPAALLLPPLVLAWHRSARRGAAVLTMLDAERAKRATGFDDRPPPDGGSPGSLPMAGAGVTPLTSTSEAGVILYADPPGCLTLPTRRASARPHAGVHACGEGHLLGGVLLFLRQGRRTALAGPLLP